MESRSDDATAWATAREHFLELADLPPAARERALGRLRMAAPETAAWVERLLEHDSGFDPSPVASSETGSEAGVASRSKGDSTATTPEVLGPYTLVRLLAVGGMGEVHLARRSDGEFERDVAVKRLRPGVASAQIVQRFLRERQTLARLDHEYIARLIDGGTAPSGQPYLVLEFVDGRHIDDYCRQERLGVRERVELFERVLEAVSYAHERGVIHRDLKPSNILIRADGQPRLLDFGIARPLADADAAALTGTGQRLFTPEFASPEQVRGEVVGSATDVFALGVVLYHLLAEGGPWEVGDSPFQLERSILESEPLAPSRRLKGRARRQVAGDLDTIVLRCLDKQPEQRFESVSELRAELERHLAGFPIKTRPTRALERLVRRGRRNPWQALAAAVLAVALFAAGQAWSSGRAAASRRAELLGSLEGTLDHARHLRVQDLNQDAANELYGLLESLEPFEDQGVFRAEVIAELSGALLRVGEYRPALELIDVARAQLPPDPGTHVRTRAMLLLHTVGALTFLGDYEAGRLAVDEALDYALEWLEPGSGLRLEAFEAVGGDRTRSLEERLEIVGQGVEEARTREEKPSDGPLSNIVNFHGVLLMESGRHEEALECFEEALAIDRWNHGEGHGDVALVRYLRAGCLTALGRLDEAREDLEAALPTFEAMGHDDMARQARLLLDAVEAQLGVAALDTDAG